MKIILLALSLVLQIAHADQCSTQNCSRAIGLWKESKGRIWQISEDLVVRECVIANDSKTLVCVRSKRVLSQLSFDENSNSFWFKDATMQDNWLGHYQVAVDSSSEHLNLTSHLFNLSFTRMMSTAPVLQIQDPF